MRLIPCRPLSHVGAELAGAYPDRKLLALALVDTYLAIGLFDLSTPQHEKYATWLINFAEQAYTVHGHYFESPHYVVSPQLVDSPFRDSTEPWQRAWQDYFERVSLNVTDLLHLHRLLAPRKAS